MDNPLVQLTVAWETDSMEQESENRTDPQIEDTFLKIRKGISACEDQQTSDLIVPVLNLAALLIDDACDSWKGSE